MPMMRSSGGADEVGMARSNSTYCAGAIPIKLPHSLRGTYGAIGDLAFGGGGRRERPSLAMAAAADAERGQQ
jgi:hypothetical protein